MVSTTSGLRVASSPSNGISPFQLLQLIVSRWKDPNTDVEMKAKIAEVPARDFQLLAVVTNDVKTNVGVTDGDRESDGRAKAWALMV